MVLDFVDRDYCDIKIFSETINIDLQKSVIQQPSSIKTPQINVYLFQEQLIREQIANETYINNQIFPKIREYENILQTVLKSNIIDLRTTLLQIDPNPNGKNVIKRNSLLIFKISKMYLTKFVDLVYTQLQKLVDKFSTAMCTNRIRRKPTKIISHDTHRLLIHYIPSINC